MEMKTQEIVKPIIAHDFCFRGSLKWFAQGNLEYFPQAGDEES